MTDDAGRPPVSASNSGGRRSDPLDQALGKLPRDVQPPRDLWPSISADMTQSRAAAENVPPSVGHTRWWLQMAAGFVLIIASSVITYFVAERSLHQQALQQAREETSRRLLEAPAMPAMPASFTEAQSLGPEYVQTRAALEAEFQKRIVELPPAIRARLQRDLADLRRTAKDIAATLDTHPSHPLLQELLLSTYQNELSLLSSVNEMAATTAPETRL